MAGPFRFQCRTCGADHEGAPSFSSDAPIYYRWLSEEERTQRALLDSDTCVIEDREFFIRVCLEVPIHGFDDPFLWGVWVSLSQKNFTRYLETWDAPDEGDCYFGWFSTFLPYYPDPLNLKTYVHPRANGLRPWIELEPTDHPLAVDYHQGITLARAQEIFEQILHKKS